MLSASNADSTLQIVKEQQPIFRSRLANLRRSFLPLRFANLPSSATFLWWRMTGSNRRPPACKAGALPAELIPLLDSSLSSLVGLVGFEPTTPALSRRCSNRLSYRPHTSLVRQTRRSRSPVEASSPGSRIALSVVTADKCGRLRTKCQAPVLRPSLVYVISL
jgi:hypothetical protein